MDRTAVGALQARIREFFLLEQAGRESASLTPSQIETIRTYKTAALGRLAAAQDLRGPSEVYAALTLYRDGVLLLALAFLIATDAGVDPASLTPQAAFTRLDEVLGAGSLEPPKELEDAKSLWLSGDPVGIDRLSTEEAARLADELEAATRWLSGLVYAPTPRELKIQRVVRMVSASLGTVLLLVLLAYWAFSPKNLAAGKTATSSSVAQSTSPAGAVDGSKNGRFGFHSSDEDAPWLAIDLGQNYLVTSVKIFGRGDCCFDQSIPLAFEASDDGVSFRPVATRTEPFSESEPWVLKPASLVARFVRLRTLRHSYLVVSEVEVYGSKARSAPAR